MRTATKNSIAEHALRDFPRESCGLILAVEGREVYRPCRNVASDDNDFRIPSDEYAMAEDEGEIIAVVHSHINRDPMPTEADLVGCEGSGVPWYIVAVCQEAGEDAPKVTGWHSFEPTGYVAPLVGRKFFHGSLDCLGLIRDFYEREMGITLPNMERADNWWNDDKGTELYLDNYESWGFKRVSDGPQYGDVIFMQYRSDRTNHAGVYLGDAGLKSQPNLHTIPNAMLHHALPRLSERVVYAGYWQDITRMIVRYQ